MNEIEGLEKLAKSAVVDVVNRARVINHNTMTPADWPQQDIFSGWYIARGSLFPLDDGAATFHGHLVRAVEEAAQKIAPLQLRHARTTTTVKYIRCDGPHSASGCFEFKVEWTRNLNEPQDFLIDPDDTDSADWWRK